MVVEFVAPGPGHWQLDRSHFTGGTTPIMRWLLPEAVESAYREQWPLLGIPAETLSVAFVEGFMYTRLRPLIRADRPSAKAPPTVLLKVASRLHPEFRRRTRAASRTLEASPAPAVIEEWHASIRPDLVARNLALQGVDLGALDDPGLADHVDRVLAHLRSSFEEHFRLHGYDLGPIGLLLVAGAEWGLASAELLTALAGASPSTVEPREALARIRAAVARSGVVPTSLAEVAAASSEAADELHAYLRLRGSVLYAGYDLDSPTLGEAPDVILASILNASPTGPDPGVADRAATALRGQVPDADRTRFDGLLADARDAMDLRDDNGPITAEWPCGLLRLAMLEAGRRLAASGRLQDPSHVFELDHHELPAVIAGSSEPAAGDLATRAADRVHQKALDPPATLGEPEAQPPLDALPAPLATTVSLVLTVIAELGMGDQAAPVVDGPRLVGTGIGSAPITGVARVAENAEEAFDRLVPGEILVTRTTSPAYNMVLTLVGGLVTAEGGPMSHAAVLSRELGIPAVVGAPDAMRLIADGDLVEVDPVAGRVQVVGGGHPAG